MSMCREGGGIVPVSVHAGQGVQVCVCVCVCARAHMVFVRACYGNN